MPGKFNRLHATRLIDLHAIDRHSILKAKEREITMTYRGPVRDFLLERSHLKPVSGKPY